MKHQNKMVDQTEKKSIKQIIKIASGDINAKRVFEPIFFAFSTLNLLVQLFLHFIWTSRLNYWPNRSRFGQLNRCQGNKVTSKRQQWTAAVHVSSWKIQCVPCNESCDKFQRWISASEKKINQASLKLQLSIKTTN